MAVVKTDSERTKTKSTPYAKVSVEFFENDKIIRIDQNAMLLYIAGLTYANKALSDGFIALEHLPRLYNWTKQTYRQRAVSKLVKVGLWSEVFGDGNDDFGNNHGAANAVANWVANGVANEKQTGKPIGYLIKDFLDYNTPKQEIEKLRSQRVKAGKKGAKVKWSKAEKTTEKKTENDGKCHSKRHSKQMPYSNYNNNKDLYPIGYNSFKGDKDNNINNNNGDKKEDEMTQKVAQLLEYEKAFEKLTGQESNALPVLDKAVKLVDEKVTIDEFETAITEMQEKGYTVATIASPIKWIMNNRNKPKPGQRQAPDMGDYKVNYSHAQIFIEPEIQEALEQGLGRPIDRELDEEWLFDSDLFKEKLRKFRPEMVA